MRRGSSSDGVVGRCVFMRQAAVVVAVALLATACGDDETVDPVAAAEAGVAAAQESVAETQAEFDEAMRTFCEETRQYITAVDRYGNVFDDRATTVAAVKTAGADLAEPRDAAAASAESVVEARDQHLQAEQELVEAEAALAEARSGTSAPQEATTTTATPLLPAATVDRVERAEADLAATSEGITDQTPLAEAGAQFNAAAVAVEVAWLRLFADAGCLTDEQQSQAVAAITEYTVTLQTALQGAGYYDGTIDGVYGPATAAAVEALQSERGLPVTGYVDRATAAALEAELAAIGGDAATAAVANTAAVQSTLKLAGYWTGPVDGTWTPELTEALMAFQTALGSPPPVSSTPQRCMRWGRPSPRHKPPQRRRPPRPPRRRPRRRLLPQPRPRPDSAVRGPARPTQRFVSASLHCWKYRRVRSKS